MPYASSTLKIANQAKIMETSPYPSVGRTVTYKGVKRNDSIRGNTVAKP
tara:strand:- start:234 stop:380 length:147 start_codon:yes stop_codon:yes gene_type:complete